MRRLHLPMRLVLLLLAAVVTLTASAISVDDVPNVHKQKRTRYVADPMGYLTASELSQADAIIDHMWNLTTAEPVVVIIDTTDDIEINDYANELFDKWKIGKSDKDNGLLLLVAVDDRKDVIRTGYGIEGVLPDITTGHIRRDILEPRLKEGRYGEGIIAALTAISDIITTPEAIEELKSAKANNADARMEGNDRAFTYYIYIGIVTAVVLLFLVIARYASTGSLERHDRYERLNKLKVPTLMCSVLFIGIPLPAFLLLLWLMHCVRRSVPKCDNCHHRMRLVDEEHDNDYLTPAQDLEEQLDSVDYDVWLCDNCGNTKVIPYVNHKHKFSRCPKCGALAVEEISNRIVVNPTTKSEGVGEKVYVCRSCGNRTTRQYRIAKLPDNSGNMAAAAIIGTALGAALGGRGGGGGGFSGGSFGGGSHGGGGSSGSW